MNNETRERLRKIWDILVDCAKNRSTITYEKISIGVSSTNKRGQFINNDLGIIREKCKEMRFPYLNTLVVHKNGGECGDGVFNQTHNYECTPDEERKIIFENPNVFIQVNNPF